ncbi:hypothetical protein ACIGJO_11530 [Streptomyces sp. NPDC079020]|uniref:hypothetical protein n=1 Tax=Streptomyces sp. NPDC079020 TaxID=3365722 RepID=UPI0037D0BC0D
MCARSVLDRLAATASSALTAVGVGLLGASPAAAVDYYKLPYPAGEAYTVIQGPAGTYSHTSPYNEYASERHRGHHPALQRAVHPLRAPQPGDLQHR